MKLSIITINYNDARSLQRTLDSVRSQTFTDYEQVVIDGGSTDESVSLLKKEASKLASHSGDFVSACGENKDGGAISCCAEDYAADKNSWTFISERLKIVSEKDKGVYDAQNKGIEMASGEYCFFLNAGDVFCSENVLERIFENQEAPLSSPHDGGGCSPDIVYGNEPIVEKEVQVGYCKGVENPTFLDLYNSCMKHQATFIRRELFERFGLYDINLRIVADWEWFFRVIAFHDEVTLQYVDVDVANFDNEGVSNRSPKRCREERHVVLDRYMSKRMQADYALLAKYHNLKYVDKSKLLKFLQRIIAKIGKILYK